MNQNTRKICIKIQNKEELDTALPQYLNQLINIYGQYSTLNFSMLYYTFYEKYRETESKSEEDDSVLKSFNGIIKEFLAGEYVGNKLQDGIKELDALRNNVINRMHILTSYTDLLEIYEYVLNRIEYRFESDLINEEQEEEVINQTLSYIFNTKDNMVINEKIKEVLGQLPIRLTKTKYFDMLQEALSIYKGGDYSSLENFLYMIKTSSTLHKVEGMDDLYPQLVKAKQYFQGLNYSDLNKEEFDKAAAELNDTVSWILEKVDFYYSLQECINQLYAMLLTHPYQSAEGSNSMKFLLMPEKLDEIKDIDRTINGYFNSGNMIENEDLLVDLAILTEGKQEELFDEMNQVEAYFTEITLNHKELIESLMLAPICHSAEVTGKLLSSSIFIDINREENERVVSEADIKQVNAELVEELTSLFASNQKVVVRAVMAGTISKLPVFFNDSNEIDEYVRNSMSACHDLAEKTATYHILKTLFEN